MSSRFKLTQDDDDEIAEDNLVTRFEEFSFEIGSLHNGTSKKNSVNELPPIGVFWDIENCNVPSGVSALYVVQTIREKFFEGYIESEFVIVCDVSKESPQIIQELNVAQVDLIHVSSTCKNAADEKLRHCIRRFADRHKSPACVLLITGDINFSSDLNDLKHRKKMHVILVHPTNTSQALILCSHEHYDYFKLTRDLPLRNGNMSSFFEPMDLIVHNLPDDVGVNRLKTKLQLLSHNCGGRVVHIAYTKAVVRFASLEAANRALKRMEGEDVFGCKIRVDISSQPLQIVPRALEISGGLVAPPAAAHFTSRGSFSNNGGNYSIWPQPRQQSTPNSQQYQQRVTPTFQTPNRSFAAEQNYEVNNPCWVHRSNTPLQAERDRIPTPQLFNRTSSSISEPSSSLFQPIQNTMDNNGCNSVDLQISNLDHSMDQREIRQRLQTLFNECVKVLSVSVYTQSDGQISARVRVPSRQDAQLAVAKLQRYIIGNRRIRISLPTGNRSNSKSPCNQMLKAQVSALLQEVPGCTLPLFTLFELYEKRYLTPISLSELHRMKDVLNITEDVGGRGRTVCLVPESRRSSTPSVNDIALSAAQDGQLPELPYCAIHALGNSSWTGWAEKSLPPLPNVTIGIHTFSENLFSLLNSHNGAIPLFSLPMCYEAEIRPLPNDSAGVPIEHLINWVKGVVLKSSPNGGCAKLITWGNSASPQQFSANSSVASEDGSDIISGSDRICSPAQLAAMISLFGREAVELLRSCAGCQLPFVKFIPAYHHHFGRQCKTAMYGFTRLIELFEAVSHAVQVIGEGDNRVVVIAQSAQIRRFTSDLLKILKSLPNKETTVAELPDLFTKLNNRPFNPVDYGLCYLTDLLTYVPVNTIVLIPPVQEGSSIPPNSILALPKRDQTPQEIERTRKFARDVICLLRGAPQCSIPFNKFIPAYHRHFNQQCRLSDYGMSKLADLLALIPDVVQIDETANGERRILLSDQERLRVVGEQIISIIKANPTGPLLLSQLNNSYQHYFGVSLDPKVYGTTTLFDLLGRLENWVQVVQTDVGPIIITVKSNISSQVFLILCDVRNYSMQVDELMKEYKNKYNDQLSYENLNEINKVVHLTGCNVFLTSLYQIAAKIRTVIKRQGGTCLLSSILSLYVSCWGYSLNPAQFNHNSLLSLIAELSDVFVIIGKGRKRCVRLQENSQICISPSELLATNSASYTNPIPIPATATSSAALACESKSNYMYWGSLLPTPPSLLPMSNSIPTASNSYERSMNAPWVGQPIGLHSYNKEAVLENLPGASMKLWSPPKFMASFLNKAPDPTELPLPNLLQTDEHDYPLLEKAVVPGNNEHSDSGISGLGQISPSSPSQNQEDQQPRRRSRIAAAFNNPIEY